MLWTVKKYERNYSYFIQRSYECKVTTHDNVVVQDKETKEIVMIVSFTPFDKLTTSWKMRWRNWLKGLYKSHHIMFLSYRVSDIMEEATLCLRSGGVLNMTKICYLISAHNFKKIMDVHENVNWLKKWVVCCSINYVIGQKWFEGLFPLIFKKNKIWGQEDQSFRYWQF